MRPKLFFWIIVFLTICALIIVLPNKISINFDSPKLPLVNKISIHKSFTKFGQLIAIGPFQFRPNLTFRKGLDLEGGTSITLRADMKNISAQKRNNALESAKTVIERRINFFGVTEPILQTATLNNDYRIIVEIPGVSDVDAAIELIGTTAQLTFWEESASPSADILEIPPLNAQDYQLLNPVKTNLTGSDLEQASPSFDPNTGAPQVQLTFTPDGAKKFADITKRNVGKRVAMVLDNQIIEAPTVKQAINEGNAVITGSFTSQQAKSLSIQLNAGALPVPLSVLEQRTIGATLGEASLQKSLFAGILGFIVIVIFMCVLYGRLGVLASLALILYILYVLALFKIFGVTLTLAGIAGLILSIGMAVDANILIFERMREELQRGRPRTVAIELGFVRAWTSIRDSNVSSIITSIILVVLGTGIVRGFALTLLIGVIVSMFSAIVVTRTFLRLIYR